jgi:hypothetical protein
MRLLGDLIIATVTVLCLFVIASEIQNVWNRLCDIEAHLGMPHGKDGSYSCRAEHK